MNPLTDNLPPAQQDHLRKLVGGENIAYHQGVLLLSPAGLRIVCQAVINGREPGDIPAARKMLARLEAV